MLKFYCQANSWFMSVLFAYHLDNCVSSLVFWILELDVNPTGKVQLEFSFKHLEDYISERSFGDVTKDWVDKIIFNLQLCIVSILQKHVVLRWICLYWPFYGNQKGIRFFFFFFSFLFFTLLLSHLSPRSLRTSYCISYLHTCWGMNCFVYVSKSWECDRVAVPNLIPSAEGDMRAFFPRWPYSSLESNKYFSIKKYTYIFLKTQN